MALCKPLRHRQPMAAVRGPDLVLHGWTTKGLGALSHGGTFSAASGGRWLPMAEAIPGFLSCKVLQMKESEFGDLKREMA